MQHELHLFLQVVLPLRFGQSFGNGHHSDGFAHGSSIGQESRTGELNLAGLVHRHKLAVDFAVDFDFRIFFRLFPLFGVKVRVIGHQKRAAFAQHNHGGTRFVERIFALSQNKVRHFCSVRAFHHNFFAAPDLRRDTRCGVDRHGFFLGFDFHGQGLRGGVHQDDGEGVLAFTAGQQCQNEQGDGQAIQSLKHKRGLFPGTRSSR